MHPRTRICSGLKVLLQSGLNGGIPPFQLRIPCHRPMHSKSKFLYTSITSRRTLEILRPQGGVRSPLPGDIQGHQARDIHARQGPLRRQRRPGLSARTWSLSRRTMFPAASTCHRPGPAASSAPGAAVPAHAIRAPRVQFLQYNHRNQVDTEPRKSPWLNRRPGPPIPPDSRWKRPRLPNAMHFRFPYRAATVKTAPERLWFAIAVLDRFVGPFPCHQAVNASDAHNCPPDCSEACQLSSIPETVSCHRSGNPARSRSGAPAPPPAHPRRQQLGHPSPSGPLATLRMVTAGPASPLRDRG